MKRLFKAILWIVCYGGACWFGIKTKLGFDILLPDHWRLLFNKSPHAPWPPDIASKKLVCKVLLVFIIVGILGLSVAAKKKKTRIPVVKGELPQKGSFRPSPVASQGRISSPSPSLPSATAQQNPQNSLGINPPAVNLIGNAIHEISDIANTFEVSIFPHVKLENTFTQLVVSDDATALLLKILPQTGTWKMTPAEQPEESLWTLENEPPKNILKDIIESTATLARLEPDASAISVVIIANGTIENPDEVKQYLEKNNIRIATLNNNILGIPGWKELLTEFYQQKESEEKNETNNTPQNM